MYQGPLDPCILLYPSWQREGPNNSKLHVYLAWGLITELSFSTRKFAEAKWCLASANIKPVCLPRAHTRGRVVRSLGLIELNWGPQLGKENPPSAAQ